MGLANAERIAGQPSSALEHLAEAESIANSKNLEIIRAESTRLRGDLLLSMGDSGAAEASYREAIAIAERQGGKLWELRATNSLAQLWRDQGKGAAACDLLAPVYAWFTEGFDAPDLREARALLDELKRVPS